MLGACRAGGPLPLLPRRGAARCPAPTANARAHHHNHHAPPRTTTTLRPRQELYLEHNQLATLPRSLAALTGLRRLYIEHNPDLLLPPELAGLPALEESHGYAATEFKGEMQTYK